MVLFSRIAGSGQSLRPRELTWTAAQEACCAILSADASNPEIPVDELVEAGAEVARLVRELAPMLAQTTGWKLDLPPD